MLRTFPRGFRWGSVLGSPDRGGNTCSDTWFLERVLGAASPPRRA